ncbi:MAG: DUF2335 domain-containing protein [Planctomycetaceae bacterium]|nr:DUF2335 domain-containing protein [Planctomycetaceae bacterium]
MSSKQKGDEDKGRVVKSAPEELMNPAPPSAEKSRDDPPTDQFTDYLYSEHREEYSQFTSPIPPPEVLQGWEDIDPALPARVVAMCEIEQRKRHELLEANNDRMDKIVTSGLNRVFMGQIFAFIIVITCIACGTFLISTGHSAEGLSSILSALGLIVLAFLGGKYLESKDAAEDPEEPPE